MGLLKIAAAGILALPALIVAVVAAPLVALLSIPSLALLCFQASEAPRAKQDATSKKEPTQEHAIVSGGSSGIGLSIAQDCVERGMAKVTIVARNQSKLEAAVKQLEAKKTNPNTLITYRSVDVSNAESLQSLAKELCSDTDKFSTKYYLFCCAGQPYPSYFEHVSASTFATLAQINQLGTIYTVQAFLPFFEYATIVFTSSMAGQVGVYGYTAYSPTKFALKGFAESLHMELCDRPHLHVQIAFPPDTDTPGFQQEEKIKPKETRLVSEDAGLAKPQDIAHSMVQAAVQTNPAFLVYFTFEGWMLTALTTGMAPVSTLADAVTQVALGGIFRFVSLFYLNDWWRMIRNSAQERIDNRQEKQRPAGIVVESSSKPSSLTEETLLLGEQQ